MKAKINKAIDFNKLLQDQDKGKLLKKILKFPLYAGTKYDGNYVVVLVDRGNPEFITSGGLSYKHSDKGGDFFRLLADGAYLCERIAGHGKLGARVRCNLRGPKTAQLSIGHSYKVFDMLSLENYYDGFTHRKYEDRLIAMREFIPKEYLALPQKIDDRETLDKFLRGVVDSGYEGLMLMQPEWKWKDTKSRTLSLAKYKKRATADLLCTGFIDGEGKYTGMIGSLQLEDSNGRVVMVGSGMSDSDRSKHPSEYINKVIEIVYEQIIDTYIQPTFIQVRHDKTKEEID